jgi:hypothetical protein
MHAHKPLSPGTPPFFAPNTPVNDFIGKAKE